MNSPPSEVVVADKGYDSDVLRDTIEAAGVLSNIPRKMNKKRGNTHMDWCLYKYRHLVENAFLKIKKNIGPLQRAMTNWPETTMRWCLWLLLCCGYQCMLTKT